eukprot:TRINITY_DN5334_c0_g2_i1.p1 TRINITY_DN5334_c0_g2~~TRINITY_DN5334_c0_g2_i1.p1  ORF type:complete len:506 (-),score=96.79 TRINITY_DN5334_c0_g2_i1:212-1729(-)
MNPSIATAAPQLPTSKLELHIHSSRDISSNPNSQRQGLVYPPIQTSNLSQPNTARNTNSATPPLARTPSIPAGSQTHRSQPMLKSPHNHHNVPPEKRITDADATKSVPSIAPATPRLPQNVPNPTSKPQVPLLANGQSLTSMLQSLVPVSGSQTHRPSSSNSIVKTQTEATSSTPRAKTARAILINTPQNHTPKPPVNPKSGSDSARSSRAHIQGKPKGVDGQNARAKSDGAKGASNGRNKPDSSSDGNNTALGTNLRRHSSDLSLILRMDPSDLGDVSGPTEVLQQASILTTGLTPTTIEELASTMVLRRFSKGEKITRQGGVADGVYFVRKGVVGIFKKLDTGFDKEVDMVDKRSRLDRIRDIRIVKIGALNPGDFFGDFELMHDANSSFLMTTQAMDDDVQVYHLNRLSFLNAFRHRDRELMRRLKIHWAKIPTEEQLFQDYLDGVISLPTLDSAGPETSSSLPSSSPSPTLQLQPTMTPRPSAFRKENTPNKQLRISVTED